MDVLMPQLGETLSEGTIATWFKQPGDMIKAGENLFEIETDKTAMEVQALTSGIVAEIRVPAGGTVAVGAVVAVIDDDKATKSISAAAVAPTNGHAGEARVNGMRSPFDEVRTPSTNFGRARRADGLRVTPLARRLIAQNGLDPDAIAASVKQRGGSKIAARDVMAAIAARSVEPSREATADHIAFNRIRRETGRRLAESWRTVPHVLQAVEIDFASVTKAREAKKDAFTARGVRLTFLPFIARAAVLAIASYPRVNAVLDGEGLLVSRDVHLGIAVDLGHDGLIVPVVHHADTMSVPGLAAAIHRQIEKARAGRLTQDDLEGATYTISNNGSFGTLFTAPIINVPQVAILSTDAIRKRPVVVETEVGDVIVPRPVGILAQSFDHRAFDGAYSAAFLSRLKEILERRDWLAEFA